MRKFIIPAIAAITFICGLISLALPFVPLGWLLISIASLLVAPYFKFMRKFIGWLAKIDTTGFVEKAGEKASELYQWVGDDKRAEKLEAIVEENSPDSKNDASKQ